tara:strand:+ start:207 stop:467 length:261 start_codon:yes stop_codon:yes gene_type:complete
MAGIGFGTNYDVAAGNGLGSSTTVISMPTANQAALDAQAQELALTHTIAGVAGAAGGTVHMALQGGAAVPGTVNGGIVVTTVITFA